VDSRVFAVDFFDDKLWEKILDSAHGKDFLENVFFCKDCCGKMRINLFTKHQWKMLLESIDSSEKTLILEYMQEQANYSDTMTGINGGEKKFFCVSYISDEIQVSRLKPNNCMDIERFTFQVDRNKDETMRWYIKKGLRTKTYSAYGKLTTFEIHVKNKKGWLYYFSRNKEYGSKEIVYCACIDLCPPCKKFLDGDDKFLQVP
jgi:hypothetical protein